MAARAWFKKVSGTVAGTARRVLRTTVPDTFLNQAAARRPATAVRRDRPKPPAPPFIVPPSMLNPHNPSIFRQFAGLSVSIAKNLRQNWK